MPISTSVVQKSSSCPGWAPSLHMEAVSPPSELGPPFLSFSSRREGKVASYVTERHFTAVRRLMYEGRNGRCWNSRPHTHAQIHTNTRLMDDTSIRSRIGARCPGADERFWEVGEEAGWRRPAAATIRCFFYWWRYCLFSSSSLKSRVEIFFRSRSFLLRPESLQARTPLIKLFVDLPVLETWFVPAREAKHELLIWFKSSSAPAGLVWL